MSEDIFSPGLSQPVDSDDYSNEYIKDVNRTEEAEALAFMRGSTPRQSAEADIAGEAMADMLQSGTESRADVDLMKSVRDRQYGRDPQKAPGAFSSVARNVADIPLSIGHGAVEGVNEASEAVHEIFGRSDIAEALRSSHEKARVKYGDDDPRSMGWESMARLYEKPMELPNPFQEPDTPTGEVFNAISQFLAGFAAGGRALQGARPATMTGRLVKAAAQGAIADFAFFDGQEARLSNLIQEIPALQNPITELLSAGENDSQLEGRLKNAVEGLGLGAATEAISKGLSASIKAIRAARTGKALEMRPTVSDEAADISLRPKAAEDMPPETLEILGGVDRPLIESTTEALPLKPLALPDDPIVEALEREGFRVEREVYGAPVAPDNKLRYGISRSALEKEGAFGERWTRITTNPEDWPPLPTKPDGGIRGALANTWRQHIKPLYEKIKGSYKVDGSGDVLIVGKEGLEHAGGQSQTAAGYKALGHLPELIKKAFKTGEYNPKPSSGKNQDMRPKVMFHSAAEIDGRYYDVQLVAAKKQDGSLELLFYDARARDKGSPAGAHVVLDDSAVSDPTMIRAGRPLETQSAGAGQALHEPAEELSASQGADLSTTRIADFFGDIKEIVDESKPHRAKPRSSRGPGGGSEGGGNPGGAAGQGRDSSASTSVTLDNSRAGKTPDDHFYINFARIDAPEDVKQVMQVMADRYKDELNVARRGEKMSFEQVKLNAEQEDAWKLLSERRAGQPLNAEQALAARNLWAASGQKLTEAAKTVMVAPTEENMFAFMKMMNIHNSIQKEVIAARTETARALASWRIPSGPREVQLKQMEESIGFIPGGNKTVLQLAEDVSKLTDAGLVWECERFIEKAPLAIARESVQEFWVMSLLSGPKTHMVNMMSNTMVGMQQVFERGVAARIGRALGDESGVQVGEGLALLNGQIGGLKDAFRLAGKAFKENQSGFYSGKVDLPPTPAISAENWRLAQDSALGQAVDAVGKVVRLPGRALMAEDEFFKTVGYRSELHALAYREATREAAAGKIGRDQVRQRMVDILENPPDQLKIAAMDHAAYSTFTDAPGRFAQGWLRFTRDNPGLRFLTPFIKTPARIFNYSVAERSPLAPLFRSFREDIAAGGARQQLALTRVSTGTAIMLAAADLAFSGNITGGGPPSQAERQTMMRGGWQPYSVKIGDRYFSYARTDPLGMTFGIAADVAEIINHMDHNDQEVDADEAATFFAASIAGNIMSKSYMSGMSSFMETMSNPKMAAKGYVSRFAGSFVPTLSAEAAKFSDPYMLEVNNMVEAMKARVPGLSKDLPARRDLWGRAISYRSGLGAFYDAVSPIASRRENPEPIDREMLRLEAYVAAPSKRVSFDGVTVDLSRFGDAYSRYAQLAGNEVRHPAWGKGCLDYLNEVVEGRSSLSGVYDMYSDGPEGGKAQFIRAAINEYRRYARTELLSEYPEIEAYVKEKKAAKPGKFNF